MSDIYLQITETPTVVTLSAPVISGALSSTVTVANTVTVALDANSLSALENVTVTVGAAITGTVTVSNFPASQAVTFSAVSISNFPASQAVTFGQAIVSASNITGLNNSVGTDGNTPTSTNFIKIGGHQDGANQVEHIVHVSAGGAMKVDASDSTVTFGVIRGTVTIGNSITIGSLPAISGTVTANALGVSNLPLQVAESEIGFDGGRRLGVAIIDSTGSEYSNAAPFPVYFTNSIPAGAARIGVVTIGAGTVTIGAGTAQIGSVTASISTSVTIASLPAISGTVTANTFALQGTAVTTSNFTSTTASTVLASFNATREVLTIFNEGAGNLHICAGATCTTIAYQVRLSAGDYYEVPNHQTTITHSAVFATAGTARVTQVS
jgi:hypothetical protein